MQTTRWETVPIVSPFLAKPFGTSESPKGAKNRRHAMPSAARAVLRPPRLALRYSTRCAMATTVTGRRFGCLIFCLHLRSRADSDKTSGPTATRGSSHPLRFRVLLRSRAPPLPGVAGNLLVLHEHATRKGDRFILMTRLPFSRHAVCLRRPPLPSALHPSPEYGGDVIGKARSPGQLPALNGLTHELPLPGRDRRP